MILVTGASGTVGRAVVEEMRKTNKPFRALYRGTASHQASPGVTRVTADFADRESLRRVLGGVSTVFLVCSPVPQLVELEGNVIEVSRELGVEHIVLNSAIGAGDYPKSFPSWHRSVEEHLKGSGIEYTILRPNSFMQNILTYFAPSIRSRGEFSLAMGEARLSLVDVRDVGTVAAKVLTAPSRHPGKTYELNGPDALTHAEIAQKISEVTGRKVVYIDIPEAAQREALRNQGAPEWLTTALLELQQYFTIRGKGAEVTETLPRLLGRAPIRLDQFLREHKDSFRFQAAGA